MPADTSFDNLVAQLRAGDKAAAERVVDLYARRLAALARKNLHRRMRSKEDPEDVLQSVFKSFFQRVSAGKLRLDNREGLWALLVSLTVHKCGHRADYYQAARRDVRREAEVPRSEVSALEWAAIARGPSPVEGAMLIETVERLLRGLKPHQQDIVKLSLEGNTTAKIANTVGLTQRTVQFVLKGVRERLQKWRDAAEKS
jgi:RNA polymerase sigma-70 factor (ECF subfamily)